METKDETMERANKVWSLYEAMDNVVPEGTSLKEVIAAAVIFIANSISQANLDEEGEEVLCNSLPDKTRTAIELIKATEEEAS